MHAHSAKDLPEAYDVFHHTMFNHIYEIAGGLKFLINARTDLLTLMNSLDKNTDAYSALYSLETIFKRILKDKLVGHVQLERITLKTCHEILNKISCYEAVHSIRDIRDMHRRLGPDRRVYALFHPHAMKEPLAFIQVALVSAMSSSIHSILEEALPTKDCINGFRCAICYSITTQQGLGGIDLGHRLIEWVVKELKAEFSQIDTFATLSPIPRFRHWLMNYGIQQPEIQQQLHKAIAIDWEERLNTFNGEEDMKQALLQLCARYILVEKQGTSAWDPVGKYREQKNPCSLLLANFHLRNGACAHQLHWKADTSAKGMKESFGIMINYNYLLDHVESNHHNYISHGSVSISEPSDQHYLSEWIGHTLHPVHYNKYLE
ncbi:malonyl-CoA decarboxylase [Spinellus fusiger]|nr:malonyl-CoA decarboxylase [Spinellus fusiger]